MFDKNLLAKKLANLEPYKVDTNKYKIRLDANESFFGTTGDTLNKFAVALRSCELNRYPDPDAARLCSAFADYFGISPENVAAGNGSDEIISIIMNCFLDKGERVMTFTPDFSMYGFYAELAELENIACPKTPDTLQIDFDIADKTIKQNGVKLVIFSNPCNPTGRIEKKSDISALAENNPNTIFVVDEAYMDFAGEYATSESFLGDVCDYSNIFVLKTLSKAIGAASLRLGFIVGGRAVIDAFKAVKSPYNVNSVSQAFGKSLLSESKTLRESADTIVRLKNELYDTVSSENLALADKYENSYTNFVFVETPNAEKIYTELKKAGILVRYFKIGVGALRITTGSADENKALVSAMRKIKEEIL